MSTEKVEKVEKNHTCPKTIFIVQYIRYIFSELLSVLDRFSTPETNRFCEIRDHKKKYLIMSNQFHIQTNSKCFYQGM